MRDGSARSATAVVDLGKKLKVPDARGASDGDLVVGVHRERCETVDIGRAQAGVAEGFKHRLGRQPQLAPARVLREVGGADADDGRLARQHYASPIVSVAVAMTWSPRLFRPNTFTVINPSSTAVTAPEKVIVS